MSEYLALDDVKCDPRCGFKCKRVAYDQAVAEADQLCARLGPGWTPRVWDNCGWNYAAHKGIASVYPRRDGSGISGGWTVTGYCAGVCSNTDVGCSSFQFCEEAEDPNDALGFAVQRANSALSAIRDEMRALL